MERIDFRSVEIDGGFWKARQDLNRDVTFPAVRKRFEETGRMQAMNCDWQEGQPNKPHFFWDSDVAKWMESAAYLLEKRKDDALEAYMDAFIDTIGRNTDEDGYFNVYYTVVEKGGRWTNQDHHELYCAGHLIEAAVAYYQATGKRKFLDIMEKYAGYIEKVFVKEKSAAFEVPGHEEIELALVKLYKCTGNQKYLDLSMYFIDRRGRGNARIPDTPESMMQQHAPVREQREARGHSVRACYLYSAMADLAVLCRDKGLENACKCLFDNITEKRMYITGGIGSSRRGECFTFDYDLPNLTAYSESCAAISLMMFAGRMSLLDCSSKYADTVERILYNNLLSSTSLSGDAFFYENPLEIQPNVKRKSDETFKGYRDNYPTYAITQRAKVFGCSCCPPNITRTIASLGDMIYNFDGDTLYVNQYIANTYRENGRMCRIETKYPVDGSISIQVSGIGKIALRIPSWCESYGLYVNDIETKPEMKNGYAYLDACTDDRITLCLDMPVILAEANAHVRADAGKVAVQRGPVVYCLEEIDNGKELYNLYVDKRLETEVIEDTQTGIPYILAKGFRKNAEENRPLYAKAKADFSDVTLKFIPYFAFANRGESEMLLWTMER